MSYHVIRVLSVANKIPAVATDDMRFANFVCTRDSNFSEAHLLLADSVNSDSEDLVTGQIGCVEDEGGEEEESYYCQA